MRKTSFLQPDIEPVDEVESLIDPIISSAASVIPLGCSYAITPSCLRALYNTTDYVPTAMSQNRLGVAGYLDQYANDADLQVSPPIFSGFFERLNDPVDIFEEVPQGRCGGHLSHRSDSRWRE
jgi:hypothetical protein